MSAFKKRGEGGGSHNDKTTGSAGQLTALHATHGSSQSRISRANTLSAGATAVSVSLFTAMVAHITESSSEQKDALAMTRCDAKAPSGKAHESATTAAVSDDHER